MTRSVVAKLVLLVASGTGRRARAAGDRRRPPRAGLDPLVPCGVLVPLALVSATAPALVVQDVDVRAEFVRSHEARDEEAVRELWRAHPGRILVTIDADLEGGLATWEAAPDAPDAAAIAAQYDRALWGARLAGEVTGRAVFLDYASAFVGWTDEQKRSFRAGQAAHGEARSALGAQQWEAAVEAARECTGRALPLGDWWGTAMGLAAEAQALLALEEHEAALAAASRARLVYQQLGLSGSELGALASMLSALEALGRTPRARACADAAVALAGEVADADTVAAFQARRAALD